MSTYSLMAVPVDYNTAEKEVYGFHVFPEPPEEKTAHCLRKAPYRVYEPMKAAGWDGTSLPQDRAFRYVCFDILPEARPGRHTMTVFLTDGEGETAAPVHSSIWRKCPPKRMPVGDHWFSLPNLASYHGLTPIGGSSPALCWEFMVALEGGRTANNTVYEENLT